MQADGSQAGVYPHGVAQWRGDEHEPMRGGCSPTEFFHAYLNLVLSAFLTCLGTSTLSMSKRRSLLAPH